MAKRLELHGYDAAADPYCYAGTAILKNLPGIRDQHSLDAYEKAMTDQRSDEPLPNGRLGAAHYRAIHRHLFQDVYAWAGKYRTIRIAKNGNAFCYPENIVREMNTVFAALGKSRGLRRLSKSHFASAAAAFLATLNAIHPFREGNGRAQLTFMALLAERAGHPLDLDRLDPRRFLRAMVQSFGGDERVLRHELAMLVGRR